MSTLHANLIYDAVRLDSVELLEACLQRIGNSLNFNMNIASALPKFEDVATEGENGHLVSLKEGYYAAQCPDIDESSVVVTALHVAIIRYQAHVCFFREEPSLAMIQFLLKHGADPHSTCDHTGIMLLYVRKRGVAARVRDEGDINGRTAVWVARHLINDCSPADLSDAERISMRNLLEMLESSQSAVMKEEFPTAKLLFSKTLSDITFICSDNDTPIPAHKCILAASSDYFETFFDGPWGEQHPDGRWTTEYTSDVIKLFLTFVYSGEVCLDSENDKGDAAVARSLMKLAHEWGLSKLFHIAQVECTLSVSLESLPAMMTEAQLYDAKLLKNQCTRLLKKNLTQVVVMHPHLTGTLASSYPELWEELSDQLESGPKRQRRG